MQFQERNGEKKRKKKSVNFFTIKNVLRCKSLFFFPLVKMTLQLRDTRVNDIEFKKLELKMR